MSFRLAQSSAGGLHAESDADLLAGTMRREQTAFSQLLERYYDRVFRVVWRLTGGHADAQDIAQETFVRLWQNPGQIRDAGALKGWLMRVAANLAMDRFRIKSTQDIEAAEHVADGRAGAEALHMQAWAKSRVDRAIASLPDRQRLALTLVHFEHMSNAAAADVMDVSVEAIESLLARARRALKEDLAADRTSLLQAIDGEGSQP